MPVLGAAEITSAPQVGLHREEPQLWVHCPDPRQPKIAEIQINPPEGACELQPEVPMGRFFINLSLALLLSAGAMAEPLPQQTKPFSRVLVLSGGGLDTALYLGIIEGLAQKGWTPDLIIATCGSSIPAAILKAKGSLPAAKNFIEGESFRKLLQSVKVKRGNLLDIAASIYLDDQNTIPHLFGKPILSVPMHWPAEPDLAKNFKFMSGGSAKTPALAILAGHAYLGPHSVGAHVQGRKTMREIVFTDPTTGWKMGQVLKTSFVGQQYPQSYIETSLEYKTDMPLFAAARASVADPYLIAPVPGPVDLGENYYLTGGIDLFPVDMAEVLGDQVIAVYGAPYSGIEVRANQNAFVYDTQNRLQTMVKEKIFAWVDASDEDRWDEKIGFDPQPKILSLVNEVPKNPTDFTEKNEKQWQLGLQRASEALSVQSDVQAHIRNPLK